MNIDRSSNIPIKKITKVLRLRLEQDQPLIILETTARKNVSKHHFYGIHQKNNIKF